MHSRVIRRRGDVRVGGNERITKSKEGQEEEKNNGDYGKEEKDDPRHSFIGSDNNVREDEKRWIII